MVKIVLKEEYKEKFECSDFGIRLEMDILVEESNEEKKMRRCTNSELSEVAEVDNDVELNIKIDKEFRNEDNKSWINDYSS
ncbi:unnamed protein product [Rhizophagus irregularis]|nr:unnamed protein product [Rhizophagus irregularis]